MHGPNTPFFRLIPEHPLNPKSRNPKPQTLIPPNPDSLNPETHPVPRATGRPRAGEDGDSRALGRRPPT